MILFVRFLQKNNILNSVTASQYDQIVNTVKVFGICLRVFLIFGKISNLFGIFFKSDYYQHFLTFLNVFTYYVSSP